jgi:hypothetical protein
MKRQNNVESGKAQREINTDASDTKGSAESTSPAVQAEFKPHLFQAIFGLHGVCVEQAYDGPLLCLPEIFVNISKQEQGHTLSQVMKVVQFPDAKRLPLE